jgi:hypothetical protein
MPTQLPDAGLRLDDFVAWRERAVEEAWEMAAYADEDVPALDNSFRITDLQHWLDLSA